MPETVRIRSVEVLAEAWGTLSTYEIDYPRSDGTSQILKREIYDHGHAAAILLHDPARDTIVLIRQFRLPVQLNGDDGFVIEACGGLLDGDDPETCARREAKEETGIEAANLRHAFTAIMSPGSLTEKLTCFIGEYSGPAPVGKGNGLAHEGEDIEVLEMTFDDALALIGSGGITDAKTIMLLQHLALQRR